MAVIAHLIAFINIETLKLSGISIFSEAFPTTSIKHYPVVIMETKSGNYEEALKKIASALLTMHSPTLTWIRNVDGYQDMVEKLVKDTLE